MYHLRGVGYLQTVVYTTRFRTYYTHTVVVENIIYILVYIWYVLVEPFSMVPACEVFSSVYARAEHSRSHLLPTLHYSCPTVSTTHISNNNSKWQPLAAQHQQLAAAAAVCVAVSRTTVDLSGPNFPAIYDVLSTRHMIYVYTPDTWCYVRVYHVLSVS